MTALYRAIMRVSPSMASRRMATSGSGDGGVPSPPTPRQPAATRGSDTAAASTPRRVASRATWPPAVPPVAFPLACPSRHGRAPRRDRRCGHLSMPWAADHRRPSRHDGPLLRTITACRGPARDGNTAAWSGYARTRQATAQVADEEVVVRTDSRHGSSRPDRARGGTGPSGPPRPGGRRNVDPAVLERLLEPVMRAAGLDLESVRVGSAGRRRLLRVVVDADGGVDLDNIALVSREASARLDDTGAMGEAPYTLEVSSPGVDRPLTQPRHWRRATGRLVRVPLAGPGDPGPRAPAHAAGQTGQKPVEGRVIAAGDN